MTPDPTTDPADLLRPLLDTAAAHGHAMTAPEWVVPDGLLDSRCPCGTYASVMWITGRWEADAWGLEEECQGPQEA